MKFSIQAGFPENQRDCVCALYWGAFGAKLGKVLRPEEKALAFISKVAEPSHAISAVDEHGNVHGVAGFKTNQGALVGGGLRDLQEVFGFLSGTWRGLLLGLLERKTDPASLLMDGIFVDETARGLGVGSALLDAVKAKAREFGLSQVRLDVIDTNPRARALYERQGFVAGAETRIGPLRHVFGFNASTTMTHSLT